MARDTFCTVKQTMFSSIFLSVSRARTLRAIKRTISRSWVRTCWWPALGGSRPAPTTAQPPATSRPPSPYRWLLLLDVSIYHYSIMLHRLSTPTTTQPPATSRPPSPCCWPLLLDVSLYHCYAASFIRSYYYTQPPATL